VNIVAPSILASNWGKLAQEISDVESAGADWIHLDVMDGQFVPPITFGPKLVTAAKEATSIPLDVHLMIVSPENHVQAFADAGADIITVHCETCSHLHRNIQQIKELGIKAGVALNPGTAIESILPVIDDIDLILVMTVNPGWGGQSYLDTSDAKIAKAAELISESGRDILLEVDGGINNETAARATAAGANALVSGTYIFGSNDYKAAVSSLK